MLPFKIFLFGSYWGNMKISGEKKGLRDGLKGSSVDYVCYIIGIQVTSDE